MVGEDPWAAYRNHIQETLTTYCPDKSEAKNPLHLLNNHYPIEKIGMGT